jgi:hypothetical protein
MEAYEQYTVKFRKVENCSCSSCLPNYVWFLSWIELPVFPPISLYLFPSGRPPSYSLSIALAMEPSSNSPTPPNPSPSLELEICRLKHMLSAHRGFLLHIDGEGGRRFEMMEEDLIQLREEEVEVLTYTTQQANNKITDMEPIIENMENQDAGQSHQIDVGGKSTMSTSSSILVQKV